MEKLWCWRCKIKVPMLDEDEFQQASLLYEKEFKNISSGINNREERFKELLDYYIEITGFNETEPNAIMHHRLSQYGPPCENCGKPYRTPKASFCAYCGNKRNQKSES